MIVRLAVILLLAIAIASVISRWRRPRVGARRPGTLVQAAWKCPDCGAYVFGSRPEPCARPDCRFRGKA